MATAREEHHLRQSLQPPHNDYTYSQPQLPFRPQDEFTGLGSGDVFLMNQQRFQDKMRQAALKQEKIFHQHLLQVTVPESKRRQTILQKEEGDIDRDRSRMEEYLATRRREEEARKGQYLRFLELQMKEKELASQVERSEKERMRSHIKSRAQIVQGEEAERKMMKIRQQMDYKAMLDEQQMQVYLYAQNTKGGSKSVNYRGKNYLPMTGEGQQ